MCLFRRVGGAQQRNVPREASEEKRGGAGPHHQRYGGSNIVRLIHFCLSVEASGDESAFLQTGRVFAININWVVENSQSSGVFDTLIYESKPARPLWDLFTELVCTILRRFTPPFS